MTASLDLGDNYQIEENSNGNLVVRDSGGTIVLKHEDGGNFQLGDAGLELGDLIDGSSGATVYDGASETLGDGSQSANLDSFNTTEATVGGLRQMEQIDTATPSDGSMSITGISGYDIYEVEFYSQLDGTGDVFLRFNGDGATTGDYVYFDETGTKNSGENEILVATATSDFGNIGGDIMIPQTGGIGRVQADLRVSARGDRISGYGDTGNRNAPNGLSDIEMGFTGNGFREGLMVLKGGIRS